jgi:hypothetical protein
MSIETFTDKTHRILGYIETMSDGKRKAWDRVFHTLGYYDPMRNVTQDKNFVTVAKGDGLSSLIFKRWTPRRN